jgi:hypothetical protein
MEWIGLHVHGVKNGGKRSMAHVLISCEVTSMKSSCCFRPSSATAAAMVWAIRPSLSDIRASCVARTSVMSSMNPTQLVARSGSGWFKHTFV